LKTLQKVPLILSQEPSRELPLGVVSFAPCVSSRTLKSPSAWSFKALSKRLSVGR